MCYKHVQVEHKIIIICMYLLWAFEFYLQNFN
jgi:hypothetical protein